MKRLITGVSGSGKTYLAQYGQDHGLPAVDADTIPGLSGWFHGGIRVTPPPTIDQAFLDTHDFLWDTAALERYLSQHDNLYFFGFAGNVFQALQLFDRAYYLSAPLQSLPERLEHPSRTNKMGKTKEQQAAILAYAKQLDIEAARHKLIVVDALQSPEAIYRALR